MERIEMEGMNRIAKRISQSNTINVVVTSRGSSTDGDTIWLDSYFKDIKDLYGLLSHEAGHIGYYSFSNVIHRLKEKISKKYQINGYYVHQMTNALEDCRIDLINKKIFPGFYKMLKEVYRKIRNHPTYSKNFLTDLIYYVQGFSDFPFSFYNLDSESIEAMKKIKKVMNSGFSPAKTVVALHLLAKIMKKKYNDFEDRGLAGDPEKMSGSFSPSNKKTNDFDKKIEELNEKITDENEDILEKVADKMIKEEEGELEEGEGELEEGEGELEEGEGELIKGKVEEGESDKKGNLGEKGEMFEEDLDLADEFSIPDSGGKSKGEFGEKDDTIEEGEIEGKINDILEMDEEIGGKLSDIILKIKYDLKEISEQTKRKVEEEEISDKVMQYHTDIVSTGSIINKNLTLIKKIEGYFKRLKATKQSSHKKSGRINNSIVRTVATNYEFDRCFSRKVKEKKPKITLLIDISGSMNRVKLNCAKTAMVVLEESLKNISELRIVLFCGYHNALNIVVKDFNEKMDMKKFDLFGHSKRYNSNIDGASIKYEAMKNKRGTIIVVSDGQPAGSGYGLQDAIPDIADAKKLTKRIFAFSIDADGGYLYKMYGNDYTNVNTKDSMDLTVKMLKFAKMIITKFYK